MNRRFTPSRGGHHHLAWESQPLVRSMPRRAAQPVRLIVLAFAIGLLAGMLIP